MNISEKLNINNILEQKSEKKTLIGKLNQLIVLILCAWVAWPLFNYRTGNYFGVALVVLWFLTTDLRWLTKKISIDIIFTLLFFSTLIIYVLTGTFRFRESNPMSIFGAIVLFFSGIFIIHYYLIYKKDIETLGRIAITAILFFTVGSIQTFRGLMIYPGASRDLAREFHSDTDLYLNIGIGGYGFSFALVFIFLSFMYYILQYSNELKKTFNHLILLPLCIMFLTLIEASFATAIIFVTFGVVLIIIKEKLILKIMITFLLIILLTLGNDFLGEFFIFLAEIFEDNQTLSTKALGFADHFLGTGEAVQALGRKKLYEMSLYTFFKNPAFGIYGPLGEAGDVGGHAGWIDMMAFYGLFTTLPMFLAMILYFKKSLFFFKSSSYYKYIYVTSVLFMLLGFVKANITYYSVGISYFLIVPSVPFLPYAFKFLRNNKTEKNEEDIEQV